MSACLNDTCLLATALVGEHCAGGAESTTRCFPNDVGTEAFCSGPDLTCTCSYFYGFVGPECTELSAESYLGAVFGCISICAACFVLYLQLRVAHGVRASANRSPFSKAERQSVVTLATGIGAEVLSLVWCVMQWGGFVQLWSKPFTTSTRLEHC